MPDYNKLRIYGLRIEATPDGLIRKGLLRGLPFLTGHSKSFTVKVTIEDAEEWREGQLEIKAVLQNPREVQGQPIKAERINNTWPAKFRVRTQWIYETGTHMLAVAIFNDEQQLGRPDVASHLVNFDVISSDSIRMMAITVILSAVIALTASALGALAGAWAGGNLFKDSRPVEVVIVEPPPASQLEIDSNEE